MVVNNGVLSLASRKKTSHCLHLPLAPFSRQNCFSLSRQQTVINHFVTDAPGVVVVCKRLEWFENYFRLNANEMVNPETFTNLEKSSFGENRVSG